jgi:hypothetical protein
MNCLELFIKHSFAPTCIQGLCYEVGILGNIISLAAARKSGDIQVILGQ